MRLVDIKMKWGMHMPCFIFLYNLIPYTPKIGRISGLSEVVFYKIKPFNDAEFGTTASIRR
ncbi:hypothetical protein TH47_17675 [Thalassospira sp. MCCC 1A02803]|nr:hypothetical protein AUQ41_00145 [Thalassospira sp. MCCC 1A02898]ONH86403.1 hypothetical protein TH47_17675 [Thalassospira sp. MCCC 1A02803]